MNIVVVDSIDLPFGGAHSMHVNLLMKGLVENSSKALLIIPYGQKRESLALNRANYGRYDGVPFYIVKNSRQKNKIYTLLDKFLSILFTSFLVYKQNRKKKIDGLIIGGMPDLIRDAPLIILCKLCNIPLYPWFVEKMSLSQDYNGIVGFLNRQSQKLTEKCIAKVSSGIIVISTLLQEHYAKYLPQHRVLLSPILVQDKNSYECSHNTDLWARLDAKYKDKTLLVYSGSFAEKDGIYTLLDAFLLTSKANPNTIFIMTGKSSDLKIMNQVTAYIEHLNLKNKIYLLGFVDSEELLYYSHKAAILFVCRSNSAFANHGFPWKLGEYCMTGNPIIATQVGDLDSYFKDGLHLFMAEVNNSKSIADKINYILNNYEIAKEIAKKGKAQAVHCLNYLTRTQEVINFIQINS